jgi:hypothetical protein
MTIKYAEITIIRNLEQEDIFRSFERYFGYENTTNDKDIIIMEFDDGTICDTKYEYVDKKFEFSVSGHDHMFPIYFKINEKNITLFYKKPDLNKDGQKKLDFNKILKNFKKYDKNSRQASEFNLIYKTYDNKEVFAICRIKTNEEKPRFILAYDSDVLDRSNLIYLVDCLFKYNFG